jgi:hypothetical protein
MGVFVAVFFFGTLRMNSVISDNNKREKAVF